VDWEILHQEGHGLIELSDFLNTVNDHFEKIGQNQKHLTGVFVNRF
jgi:hypothetical protein